MSGLLVRVRGSRRRQRGQGLVEFAFILPVFLAMLFALVDGVRFVYMTSVLSQAAREGARLAAVEASWIGSADVSCGASGGTGPVCPASTSVLETHARTAANRMVTPFGPIASGSIHLRCTASGAAPIGAWTGVSCTSNKTNNVVSVRIALPFVPLTPIAAQFLALTVTGSATMVIN